MRTRQRHPRVSEHTGWWTDSRGYSIATQGYVIKASETTNYIDLSQIDFDTLRAKFDKGRKPIEAQKLRSQITQKLTRMIRLNRTRIDFLQAVSYTHLTLPTICSV